MKKLLFLLLAVVLVFSLVACQKEEVKPVEEPVQEPVAEEPVQEPIEEINEEMIGVGNTDESMVYLVLESYLKDNDPDIEEVIPVTIKVLTSGEIAELPSDLNIKEGDIPFEAEYTLKIKDTVSGDDLMRYTAATGEIDGQYIRNKANLGICRASGDGYVMDAFGTGW